VETEISVNIFRVFITYIITVYTLCVAVKVFFEVSCSNINKNTLINIPLSWSARVTLQCEWNT